MAEPQRYAQPPSPTSFCPCHKSPPLRQIPCLSEARRYAGWSYQDQEWIGDDMGVSCIWGSRNSRRCSLSEILISVAWSYSWTSVKHTGITSVGVLFQTVTAFCELESGLGHNLVEGEGAATESLAGVTMASKRLAWSPKRGSTSHYHRTCLAWSGSSVTSQEVSPQWHDPSYVVIASQLKLTKSRCGVKVLSKVEIQVKEKGGCWTNLCRRAIVPFICALLFFFFYHLTNSTY